VDDPLGVRRDGHVDAARREPEVTRSRLFRRLTLPLASGGLAVVVAIGAGVPPAQAAGNPVARRDASTGWITDVSPSQVASVVSQDGNTTVFVRGTDSRIWFRTDLGGSWSEWSAVPGATAVTSGPAAVAVGGFVYVLARGPRNEALYQLANLTFGTGQPQMWNVNWTSLGGSLTSAPAIASVGDSLSVVGRGGDGAIWQRFPGRLGRHLVVVGLPGRLCLLGPHDRDRRGRRHLAVHGLRRGHRPAHLAGPHHGRCPCGR
jgi:hypothetical protein